MTSQSVTVSTEYHYWPSDIWSNQWNKNCQRNSYFIDLTSVQYIQQYLSHSFFAFEDSALMLLIFVINHSVFAQINYWGHYTALHCTGDKLFSLDVYLYSICIWSGRVRSHGVRSKPRVWDAGVASFTVRWETHVSMPGQRDGRCWHCRGRTTTESSARLSSAAVTALWSSQGVEERWRWNHSNWKTSPLQPQHLLTTQYLYLEKIDQLYQGIFSPATPDMLAVAAMCFHRSRQVSPRS